MYCKQSDMPHTGDTASIRGCELYIKAVHKGEQAEACMASSMRHTCIWLHSCASTSLLYLAALGCSASGLFLAGFPDLLWCRAQPTRLRLFWRSDSPSSFTASEDLVEDGVTDLLVVLR